MPSRAAICFCGRSSTRRSQTTSRQRSGRRSSASARRFNICRASSQRSGDRSSVRAFESCRSPIASIETTRLPRGGEQERFRQVRALRCRGVVHARVDLLPQIVDLVALVPGAREETRQRFLVRQDFTGEPVVEIGEHVATLAPMRAFRTCRSSVRPQRDKWGMGRAGSSRLIWMTTTGTPMPLMRASIFLFGLMLCGVVLPSPRAIAADAPKQPYEYFQVGDIRAARPEGTRGGLMLMGGGTEVDAAFAWLVAHAGHGHIVILRASGDDELQKYIYHDVGNVASVQTLIFHDRAQASDPRVLDIVRHADGIFIAGGDQANYVRFWKGTPLNALIDAHVREGKPIGGTSAGLAILGKYSYGALDGGSITAPEALANPLGSAVTLVDDFLHLPPLYGSRVITDSHFDTRERLGRLLAFMANLARTRHTASIVGLGIDENTALCIDEDGQARFFSGHAGGHADL